MKKMLCIAGILALAGAQSSFATGPSYSSASGKTRVYLSHNSSGHLIGSHSSGHFSNSHHNSHNSHSYAYNSHNAHNYSVIGSHHQPSHHSYNSHSISHGPSHGFSISVGSVPSYSSSHFYSSYSIGHHPRVCTKRHGHYQYRSERYITGYSTRQEKYYVPGSTYQVWDSYTNCYITRTNGGYYAYRTVKVPHYATRRVKYWVSSPCDCF